MQVWSKATQVLQCFEEEKQTLERKTDNVCLAIKQAAARYIYTRIYEQ